MSEFADRVIMIVRQVPRGKVVSYGQVAAYAGVPRGARAVGWILRNLGAVAQACEPLVPWWRVINNAGRISIKNMEHEPAEQRDLLQAEGVEVSESFEIEIEKYRFLASDEQTRRWGLPEEYLQMVWRRFGKGY